ncbi:MAG: hypothetical protein VX223_01770 [Myxococcota bacterium]|nr:hypothetical protein [Myxococcota bacterium]
MVQLIPVAVVSLCLMCCASLDASNAIDASAKALLAAENQGAAEYARYKYTKAELLLTAAKIRNGHGDFQIAQEWAGKAQLLASDAEQTARSRKNLEEQKDRIKRAAERSEKATPKNVAPKLNREGKKTNSAKPRKPQPKRKRLLPPPRNKRRLLPPKRPTEDNQ